MSTAAYTPGPWTTGGHDIKANDGNILVGAIFHSISASGKKDGEAIANARLIAAAPDLLTACKDCMENHGDWGAAMAAAIAKAEGRS